MCGRYALVGDDVIQMIATWRLMGDIMDQLSLTRKNVSPTQPVPAGAVVQEEKSVGLMRWGWERPWMKNRPLINAQAEEIDSKKTFAGAFRENRCIIPASWFYEWMGPKGARQPVKIGLKSGDPFFFAGLWESRKVEDDGPKSACTIITTEANDLLKGIHPRMAAILPPGAEDMWLDDQSSPGELLELLVPFPEGEMGLQLVDKLVPDQVRPLAPL